MTKSILCPVFIGILVGAAAFFMPHLLIGILILFLIIKLLHCDCRGHGCCGHRHGHDRFLYMADKIRKMSEEEYDEFKTKMGGGCCDSDYHSHGNCGCNSDSKKEKNN